MSWSLCREFVVPLEREVAALKQENVLLRAAYETLITQHQQEVAALVRHPRYQNTGSQIFLGNGNNYDFRD